MTQLLQTKAGDLTIMDAVLIAGAKSISERILTNFIGNGTLMSGAMKIAGAIGLVSGVKGKTGKILGTALMVDGGEDLVTSVLGGAITSIGQGSSGQASVSVM